jgi:hypothetical protein
MDRPQRTEYCAEPIDIKLRLGARRLARLHKPASDRRNDAIQCCTLRKWAAGWSLFVPALRIITIFYSQVTLLVSAPLAARGIAGPQLRKYHDVVASNDPHSCASVVSLGARRRTASMFAFAHLLPARGVYRRMSIREWQGDH